MKQFEEMRIWQDGRILTGKIYRAFSSCKDYSFKDQIQRAAVSIINNISEGYERSSKAEFVRFLDIAKGSAGEVRNMLYLAQDLGYLEAKQSGELIAEVLAVTKGIGALRKYLRNNETSIV